MKKNTNFDVDGFSSCITNSKTKQYHAPTSYIARVPLPWIAEAAKLPGRAVHVALSILYVYGLYPGQETILTRSHFKVMNIPRGADKRGMDALQQAGLIEYTKAGNRYLVNILPVKSDTKTITVKDKTHSDYDRQLTTRTKTNGKTKATKTPGLQTENNTQSNVAVMFRELQETIAKLNPALKESKIDGR